MKAEVVTMSEHSVTIQVEIPLGSSMLEGEEEIQRSVNMVGALASGKLLEKFDTDGSPIKIGARTLTSKGELGKVYQTPYGPVKVERHVYQGSEGGATYCPLEDRARIIITSTPRFAKQISSKYSDMPACRVVKDFRDNHGRKSTISLIQDVSTAVGGGVLAKEESWTYALPKFEKEVSSIGIGIDGAMFNLKDDGWREGMVGSVTLYDAEGTRLHSIYVATAPEYGKESFLTSMEREIAAAANSYPLAIRVGIADGAHTNWSFLSQYTEVQILDFYHATEYLAKAADDLYPKESKLRKEWLDTACHNLKHNANGAKTILRQMISKARLIEDEKHKSKLLEAIRYFRSNLKRMKYSENLERNLPIGSGVTEAAAKTIIKQRLCLSGMRWLNEGATVVLSLRALSQSGKRWNQFWEKISRYGFPIIEKCFA
jgi:hypothetical protein